VGVGETRGWVPNVESESERHTRDTSHCMDLDQLLHLEPTWSHSEHRLITQSISSPAEARGLHAYCSLETLGAPGGGV
jgi:hypothetical protein